MDFESMGPMERRAAFMVASEALRRVERVRDTSCLGTEFQLPLDLAYGRAAEELEDLLGEIENSYPDSQP